MKHKKSAFTKSIILIVVPSIKSIFHDPKFIHFQIALSNNGNSGQTQPDNITNVNKISKKICQEHAKPISTEYEANTEASTNSGETLDRPY